MVSPYLAGLRLLAIRFISFLLGLPPVWVTIGRQKFLFDPKRSRLLPAVAGASPDDDDDDKDDDADADADDSDKGDDDKADKDDADEDKGEPNWKRLSRRHERARKRAEQERDDAKRKLQEQEDAKKTDQQKAVDEAAKTAREEAETKFEQERRHDRLENVAIRVGAKGIKVGEGKDAKTVRLSDPDDALVFIERDIKNGELEMDDLFDDKGKVDREKLEEAIADLYDRKPRLFEDGADGGTGKSKPRVKGGGDGGKGDGDLKTPEEGSVDDHLKAVRRSGKKD